MSFDIFLHCIRKGGPGSFNREVFDQIFLPYCADPEGYRSDPKFMQVEYPDGGGSDIYLGSDYDDRRTQMEIGLLPEGTDIGVNDKTLITHLMFNHCGGDMFFEAMYKLADRTQSVVFWPNVPSLIVVTNEAVLKELGPDFPGVDNPRIVRSGADIVEAIRNS